MNIPEPPMKSSMRLTRGEDSIVISWQKQFGGLFRVMKIILVGGLMCIIILAFVLISIEFVANGGPVGVVLAMSAGIVLFLFIPSRMLFLLLRPEEPESVTLVRDHIRYDTGTAVAVFLDRSYLVGLNILSPYSKMFQRQEVDVYSREDSPRFVLEGRGLRQQLKIDDRSGRVRVVGDSLRKADRLWLANALNIWKNSEE